MLDALLADSCIKKDILSLSLYRLSASDTLTIVYLIDTISGKEQILQDYNARMLYRMRATELDGINFDDDMFETYKHIVINTYAKNGAQPDPWMLKSP